jgi:hypothetical protein
VIISAEKVCRLFRYRSGLAALRLPLHKQHTYSANHKYSHFTPIPFIIPTHDVFVQRRYVTARDSIINNIPLKCI